MGVEFLILTVYFICVVYVLYQMALSVEDQLEDQLKIELQSQTLQDSVNAQLQQQTLYQAQAETQTIAGKSLLKLTFFAIDETAEETVAIGTVALQIAPQGKLPLQPPLKALSVSVVNTLPDQQVFLQWDRSAISVHGGFAQRVIRQVPGSTTDLLPSQAPTVVNPGLQTNVKVTAEGLLTRPENQVSLEVGPALVDLSRVPAMKEPMRQYTLQVVMWVRSVMYPNDPALQLILPFTFRIEVLPDHVALPVLGWLLNFNPFAPRTSQKPR